MNYYKENIKYLLLNATNREIVEKLDSGVDISKEYSIALSKDKKQSLLYNNKAITSIYSPYDEAKRLVDLHLTDKHRHSKYLLGIFSGISSYNHIEYFLSLNVLNKAIIIEADLSLLKLILSSNIFESLSRVVIVSEDNFSILQHKLDSLIKEREIVNTLYIRHARASQINASYYDNVERIYSTIAKEKILSLKTSYYFSQVWARNVISNLVKHEGNSIESFIGVLKNKIPILVVSAGSSIDSKLSDIKKISKTHFVLALSHAINTLIKNDILPDAVITTDGGFYSYPHLYNIKNNKDIKIFTTHTSYPSLFNNIDKKNIFYFSHRESFETMLYDTTPSIAMCGSVIMPAISIAYLMNPSYILLAGTDFCYIDNNTHSKYSYAREFDYFSSTKLDTFENKNYRRLNIYDKVFCYDKEYRLRSESLKSYFRHFEILVNSIDKKFYTLTDKSAKIDKVEIFDMLSIEGKQEKKIEYENILESVEKDSFLGCLNNFFYEVEHDNTDTMLSPFADIISPFYIDNNSSFSDFKREILSFKKLLSGV